MSAVAIQKRNAAEEARADAAARISEATGGGGGGGSGGAAEAADSAHPKRSIKELSVAELR